MFHLLKGVDPLKDQSYFLSRMTQTQLSHACFPLGGMTKTQVIQLAQDLKLEPVHHGESQDICFIKGRSYGEFLSNQKGFISPSGPIATVAGNIIGEHPGLHLFTIGQRRGINCPAAQPYYVVRLDRKANKLIVGFKSDLLASSCQVSDINWTVKPLDIPERVYTRVRFRSQAVRSMLYPAGPDGGATVLFDSPQLSVTPGQGAVFYRQDDELIGGGWITRIPEKTAAGS
jgi:tRNA-specific 2-thiouridylase